MTDDDLDWREWRAESLPWEQLRVGMRLPHGTAISSVNDH